MKIMSPVFIILIVVVLILASTLVIVVGGNNNSNNGTTTGSAGTGSSELYVAIAPDIYPGYLTTKEIGNGQSISFNKPGTSFNLSTNETINMTVSVINHQNKAMNYSILAYQAIDDTENNTYNLYQLYLGHIDNIMQDHTIGWVNIQVQASASDNSTLGVFLMDFEGGNATIVNDTEFSAKVLSNLIGNSTAPEPILFFTSSI